MDVYKIDVTGDDILSKGYGVIVLYNSRYCYAYKFSSSLQSKICNYYKVGEYGITKRILKPRLYCAVLSKILHQISKEKVTHDEDFQLQICNDFDGHQNDIIQILKEHTKDLLVFGDITVDNYVFTRHPKKSKIQQLALTLGRGGWENISRVRIDESELHNLIAKRSCRKIRW